MSLYSDPAARNARHMQKINSLTDLIVRGGGYTSKHMVEHLWRVDRRTVRRTLDRLVKDRAITIKQLPVSSTKIILPTRWGWADMLSEYPEAIHPRRRTDISQLAPTRIRHTLSVQRAMLEHIAQSDIPELWNWEWDTEVPVGFGPSSIRADAEIGPELIEVELSKNGTKV